MIYNSYQILKSIYEFIKENNKHTYNIQDCEVKILITHNANKYDVAMAYILDLMRYESYDAEIESLQLSKGCNYMITDINLKSNKLNKYKKVRTVCNTKPLTDILDEIFQEDEYAIQQELIEDLNASRAF